MGQRKLILVWLLGSGLLLASCTNDFEVLAPYKDIPLVYSILDPAETTHYVRVERGFAGKGNAFDMAANPDSVYYQHVAVMLERWVEKSFRERYAMIPTDQIPKDQGMFATDPHILFRLDQVLDAKSEYRLDIRIADIDRNLVASTFLVSGIRLTKPQPGQLSMSFANYDEHHEIEWVTSPGSRLHYLQFRLNYIEIAGNDTLLKQALWSIGHFASADDEGGQRMETLVSNRRFYQWIPSKIPPPDEGMKRIIPMPALDIIFTMGGEDLYTYLEIHQGNQNPMIQKPLFTNIENGYGIFSSRTTQEIKGKALSYATIDSIALGQYTGHLGFVDSTDDYYRK